MCWDGSSLLYNLANSWYLYIVLAVMHNASLSLPSASGQCDPTVLSLPIAMQWVHGNLYRAPIPNDTHDFGFHQQHYAAAVLPHHQQQCQRRAGGGVKEGAGNIKDGPGC